MDFSSLLDKQWILDNLIAEIIFGVLLLGGIGLGWQYIRDAWKVIRIYRIVSTHNNPTRTRRKGIHALDRFMDIYESKLPLVSQQTAYNTGHITGVWHEQYLDTGILELHGLVTVKETPRGMTTEAKRDRISKWVYKLAKFFEERERQRTESFVLDKTGMQRKLPPR